MAESKRKNYRTALWIILSVIALFSYAASYSLGNNTMTSFPVVTGVSFAVASAISFLAIPFWRKVTGSENTGINIAANIIFMTGLLAALFYTLNFAFSENATRHTEPAVVINKYIEVRHHSKRVSRNRYVRGEAYNVYYIDLTFENGSIKPFPLKQNLYSKISVGDTISVPVEKGLFGIPVIKRNGSSIDVRPSSYRY